MKKKKMFEAIKLFSGKFYLSVTIFVLPQKKQLLQFCLKKISSPNILCVFTFPSPISSTFFFMFRRNVELITTIIKNIIIILFLQK